MSQVGLISIIITTYDRPDALIAVLNALTAQTDKKFEIIIADDGSTMNTLEAVYSLQWPFSLRHVWQPDDGFRAASIRNKAVTQARGDYLIFLDGDCVPLPSFVATHRMLAEKKWLVVGNRILLSELFTKCALTQQFPLHLQDYQFWREAKKAGKCNRTLPFLHLPLGPLRKLRRKKWRGAMTCNLAVWRCDFDAVNGFDINFSGWGYEDSDLVVRMLARGVRVKSGRFAAPVLHLWHKENDRQKSDDNWARLQATVGGM